ncbi:unnamed protein product [Prorocentrum cordatum]|uniref:Uncharacterized protein n=1 Tax=Prorocentrum cordatum TaxID=2364126 RepID=A0ABN9TQ15_9DINO|nr:unnamed protein product [Polarella glacialis]
MGQAAARRRALFFKLGTHCFGVWRTGYRFVDGPGDKMVARPGQGRSCMLYFQLVLDHVRQMTAASRDIYGAIPEDFNGPNREICVTPKSEVERQKIQEGLDGAALGWHDTAWGELIDASQTYPERGASGGTEYEFEVVP